MFSGRVHALHAEGLWLGRGLGSKKLGKASARVLCQMLPGRFSNRPTSELGPESGLQVVYTPPLQ